MSGSSDQGESSQEGIDPKAMVTIPNRQARISAYVWVL